MRVVKLILVIFIIATEQLQSPLDNDDDDEEEKEEKEKEEEYDDDLISNMLYLMIRTYLHDFLILVAFTKVAPSHLR